MKVVPYNCGGQYPVNQFFKTTSVRGQVGGGGAEAFPDGRLYFSGVRRQKGLNFLNKSSTYS